MADGATSRARPANRRAIGATCAVHRGPRGFANLVVEKQGEEIILDPQSLASASSSSKRTVPAFCGTR